MATYKDYMNIKTINQETVKTAYHTNDNIELWHIISVTETDKSNEKNYLNLIINNNFPIIEDNLITYETSYINSMNKQIKLKATIDKLNNEKVVLFNDGDFIIKMTITENTTKEKIYIENGGDKIIENEMNFYKAKVFNDKLESSLIEKENVKPTRKLKI